MPFEDQNSQDQKANQGNGDNQGNGEGNQPYFVAEDGREFKTKEDFVKSWSNGQAHIQKLEAEANERNAAAAAQQKEDERKTIASEVLNTVREELNSRKTDQDQGQASKAELSKDELKALIRSELAAEHSESKKQANNDVCMDSAKTAFGDSYQAKVAERAKELGMSMDDVNDMADRSPAAFNELFIPKQQQGGNNFRGNVDTRAIDQNLQGNDKQKSMSISSVNSTEAGNAIKDRMAAAGIYEMDKQELKRGRY